MLETELRVTDTTASFVVRTDVPAFKDALPGLAYPAVNGEFARQFPAGAPDLERIFGNFERSIKHVLRQASGLEAMPWKAALRELVSRLEPTGAEWFLMGSAALAVRGIAAAPRDIDFVTSEHDLVAQALADVLIEPPVRDVERRWIAAWFGRAYLGARVEWAAEVYSDVDEPSETGAAAMSRLETVEWEGRSLLLSPLDVQVAVNQKRGLEDRVRAIRDFSQP